MQERSGGEICCLSSRLLPVYIKCWLIHHSSQFISSSSITCPDTLTDLLHTFIQPLDLIRQTRAGGRVQPHLREGMMKDVNDAGMVCEGWEAEAE